MTGLHDAAWFDRTWERFARTVADAPEALFADDLPGDLQTRAEGYRYVTRLLRAGIAICMEHDDPDHPDFTRLYEPFNSYGIDNPDYHYLVATIRGDATYRIRGTMGNAQLLDIGVLKGHFARGPTLETLDTIDTRSLGIAPGDPIDVVIGPEPHEGTWLRSGDGAETVLVRQLFVDWTQRQVSAEIRIERDGARYPPPVSVDGVAGSLTRLEQWMSVGLRAWDDFMRFTCRSAPMNTMQWFDAGPATGGGGKAGQHYAFGGYTLDDRTALVIEWEPPDAAFYWMFGVGSWFWETFDPWRRQVSINDFAAELDDDGRFRGVVATRDPGVANWLDVAGNRSGTLVARCIDADSVAAPTTTVVAIDDIAEILPSSTKRVTPEERAASLRLRHRAGRHRMRV